MSLNVLVTAASRRVAARAGVPPRARRAARARVRSSAPTSTRCRRPCTSATGPTGCRSPATPATSTPSPRCATARTSVSSCRPSTTNCPLFGGAVARFAAHGHPGGGVARSRRRASATTSTRRAAACADAASRPPRRSCPRTLPADSAVPDVRQAARRPRQHRRLRARRTPEELDFFLDYVEDPGDPGVSRRAPSSPSTCSATSTGRPLSVVPARARRDPRRRHRPRPHGDRPDAHRPGARVRPRFRFDGPINVQCRLSHGRPIVFEINPRFSGGIPLTIAAGADFPRMLLELALGPTRRPGHRPVPARPVDDQLRVVVVPRPARMNRLLPVRHGAAHVESRLWRDVAVIVLQARMGSTRLPGQGARAARPPHAAGPLHPPPAGRATSGPSSWRRPATPADDAVAAEARAVRRARSSAGRPTTCWPLRRRGRRVRRAGYIVRATADNPAVDIDTPRRMLETVLRSRRGVRHRTGASQSAPPSRSWPADTLRRLARLTADPEDREHVTLYHQADMPRAFRTGLRAGARATCGGPTCA